MSLSSSTSSLLKPISPISFRSRNEGSSNPKWKQFNYNIERALSSWDGVVEWADYISFLAKLNKALKSGSSSLKIPQASQVASRLARCLDSGLPAGVHQKALEVYNTVFEIIQGQELHSEIHLWLPGLLPLMSYASINAKPPLIALFENHILPLPSLRNILRPLLLSFLPGIDDESSESFNDALKLIEDIKLKVNDDSHFWQCFFQVVISSPERRLGALVWANKHFPDFKTVPQLATSQQSIPGDIKAAYRVLNYEAQMAITPEPGLLIRAFCQGLQDEQALVQRGFLELLVKSLDLQSVALQIITPKQDLQLLVLSACSTVLRRDMSLNRRLWNWLLGPEPIYGEPPMDSFSRARYFTNYGSESLINALLEMIEIPKSDNSGSIDILKITTNLIRAGRICLSILDRWEIGSCIVPKVLIPIIKSVKYLDSLNLKNDQYSEMVRSIGSFFDGIEAINIWSDCLALILDGDLNTFHFILEVFNVGDEEMIVNYLPLMLVVLLYAPLETSSNDWFNSVASVLTLIPERAFLPIDLCHQDFEQGDDKEIISSIQAYFSYALEQNDTPATLPFAPQELCYLTLDRLASLTYSSLLISSLDARNYCTLLSDFLVKLPSQKTWRSDNLLKPLCPLSESTPFDALHPITRLFQSVADTMTDFEIDQFVFSITPLLWKALCGKFRENHVEAVKIVWELQDKLEDKRIQSALATSLISPFIDFSESSRAFTSLWNLSFDRPNCSVILDRCLFLFLDKFVSLEDDTFKQLWLDSISRNTSSGEMLLRMLMEPIIDEDTRDIESFAYYMNVLDATINGSSKIKEILFKSPIGSPVKVSFSKVNNIALSFLESENCLQQSEGLRSIIKLFSSTLASGYNISSLMLSIFSLLSRFDSYDDVSCINQIDILELLGKLLDIVVTSRNNHDADENISTNMPNTLVKCLLSGISELSNEITSIAWIKLLVKSLNILRSFLLQVLIPLSDGLCSRVNEVFNELMERASGKVSDKSNLDPQIFFSLMGGLETLIVSAHDRLSSRELTQESTRSPSDPGFLGNVISGVFSVESPVSKSASANDRLTVLLAFQDVIKLSYKVWKWVDVSCSASESPKSSLVFLSSRFKSQARKVLVKIFKLEPMETIECLIEISQSTPHVFKVIHVLDGSRPNLTVPHIINSLISRINPNSLEEDEKSTLSSDINEFQTANFFVEYLQSLENDAIEEIWYDCMGFVREVNNHLTIYRPILPYTLKVIVVMSNKVNSVKFGEQRKIRKELSDLFIKILYNALNTRLPDSANHSTPQLVGQGEREVLGEKVDSRPETPSMGGTSQQSAGQEELSQALEFCLPHLRVVVLEQDKVLSVISTISVNFIAPYLKAKLYSAPGYVVSLLTSVVNQSASQKSWKATVGDFFLDPRFLTMSQVTALSWKPIISKWSKFDKERVHDFLSRVNNFGSNSTVLFGWSEQESTIHKANLTRAAFLFLCGNGEGYNINFKELVDKFESLMLDSTPYVFTCLRAIVLSVDSHHLQPIWTFIYTQLDRVFSDFSLDSDFNVVLSACKLLDLLLVVVPEEFQINRELTRHEWLFICDNIEAIFRNEDRDPSGVIDYISRSRVLNEPKEQLIVPPKTERRPLLSKQRKLQDFSDLKPFFDQLSIFAYEGAYSLVKPDLKVCEEDILLDLFDEKN